MGRRISQDALRGIQTAPGECGIEADICIGLRAKGNQGAI